MKAFILIVGVFLVQTPTMEASAFDEWSEFQDGDSGSDSYGGGYYTSTHHLDGTLECGGSGNYSCGGGLSSITFDNFVDYGTVYRNDGYTETYYQPWLGSPACQTNRDASGNITWSNCPGM